jgi:hypothetical protein
MAANRMLVEASHDAMRLMSIDVAAAPPRNLPGPLTCRAIDWSVNGVVHFAVRINVPKRLLVDISLAGDDVGDEIKVDVAETFAGAPGTDADGYHQPWVPVGAWMGGVRLAGWVAGHHAPESLTGVKVARLWSVAMRAVDWSVDQPVIERIDAGIRRATSFAVVGPD